MALSPYRTGRVKGVKRVEGVSPSNRGQDARDTITPSTRGLEARDTEPPRNNNSERPAIPVLPPDESVGFRATDSLKVPGVPG